MDSYSDPKIWGPHFWFIMKCVAFKCPTQLTQQDKHNVSNFYNSLRHLLPCKKCRWNYNLLCERYPLEEHYQTRLKLMAWVELLQQETEADIHKKDGHNCNDTVCQQKQFCESCHAYH